MSAGSSVMRWSSSVERNRARPVDVASGELLDRPYVDENDFAVGRAGRAALRGRWLRPRRRGSRAPLAGPPPAARRRRRATRATGEAARDGDRVEHARCPRVRARQGRRRVTPADAATCSRSIGHSRGRARRRSGGPGRADRVARADAGWRTPCPSARSPRTGRPSRCQYHGCYSSDQLIACQACSFASC